MNEVGPEQNGPPPALIRDDVLEAAERKSARKGLDIDVLDSAAVP